MLLAIAALLLAASDAGPAEQSIDVMVKDAQAAVCKSPKSHACVAFTAFLNGKPPALSKPLLTIGAVDIFSMRSKTVEAEVAFALSIEPAANEATVFRITPDTAEEKAQLTKFVTDFAAGKPDLGSELFAMMKQGASKQPKFKLALKDHAAVFELDRPLGGHWIRAVGKKLYVVGFAGTLESPAVFVSELRDPR